MADKKLPVDNDDSGSKAALSEKAFKAMLENSPDAIALINRSKRILFANPLYSELTGYSPKELSICFSLETVHPDDRLTTSPLLIDIFETSGKMLASEYRLLTKTGNWVWLETHAINLMDNPQVKGIMFRSRNITSRKLKEQNSHREQTIIVESQKIAHFGSFEYIAATKETIWSDEEFHIYGIDPAQGSPSYKDMLKNNIHPDDVEQLDTVFQKAKENGGIYELEHKIVRPDGTVRIVHDRAHPYFDDNGNLYKYIGTTVDITEHKRAEEALRLFRSLIDQTNDSIEVIDPETGQFLDVNEKACQDCGYTREEYLKLKVEDVDPQVAAHSWEAARDRIKHPGTHIVESQHRRKDGSLFPVEVNITYIRLDRDYFLAVVRDITERKTLEEQLRQAQKMESVGRLAGGVAHDFNNMLGVIIGHTELALHKLEPDQPLFEPLQEIRKAAERSANLTRQLLAFARRQPAYPLELDLNQSVEGMLTMLRRLIGEDIDFAWLPAKGALPVKMDPSQLDQILANLCVNARDAIAGVGRVTIETRQVNFDAAYCAAHPGYVPGDYILLVFSDDGCGIECENLDKVFEPFFTTKPLGQGTGLGLATVYGIVRQNNGFINVYSEPGQGTTFNLYLPRHTSPFEQIAHVEPAVALTQGTETILLVEDEPLYLNMAKQMLASLGYQVLTAATPGEAFRIDGEYGDEIHLLISDMVMPEMNGLDLAKKLKTRHADLRLLFMSGYSSELIAHRGILAKGVNYIQKPFTLQDLATKVRAVLASKNG